jgi:hypothetical protein
LAGTAVTNPCNRVVTIVGLGGTLTLGVRDALKAINRVFVTEPDAGIVCKRFCDGPSFNVVKPVCGISSWIGNRRKHSAGTPIKKGEFSSWIFHDGQLLERIVDVMGPETTSILMPLVATLTKPTGQPPRG